MDSIYRSMSMRRGMGINIIIHMRIFCVYFFVLVYIVVYAYSCVGISLGYVTAYQCRSNVRYAQVFDAVFRRCLGRRRRRASLALCFLQRPTCLRSRKEVGCLSSILFSTGRETDKSADSQSASELTSQSANHLVTQSVSQSVSQTFRRWRDNAAHADGGLL